MGRPLDLKCHCFSFPLAGSQAWGQWAGFSEKIRYELRHLYELLRPSCLSQPWWSSHPSISKAEPAVHSQDWLNALVLSLLAGRCPFHWPKEHLFPYASQRGQRTWLLPPGLGCAPEPEQKLRKTPPKCLPVPQKMCPIDGGIHCQSDNCPLQLDPPNHRF